MNFETIIPDKSISLFVKNILVFESPDIDVKSCLPFFADGFPGLIFQQTQNGLVVQPHNKIMPAIFVYGQTIKPIHLEISGSYLVIIFQLYPFVLNAFFDIVPQTINDDCYHLKDTEDHFIQLQQQLSASNMVADKIEIISKLLLLYFEKKRKNLDFVISQAIDSIVDAKGLQKIPDIAKQLNLHVRTFERRFLSETGISPKQFSNIIQFQCSLRQLTIKDYNKLNDIVYQNGFSDQSHFIKVFKAFTGKTPKTLSK